MLIGLGSATCRAAPMSAHRGIIMAISLYFGLPGCGKTTLMVALAKQALYDKKHKYKHVYSNVRMALPGYIYIDNDCIGKYDLSDSLILIDEATLFADNRDYKNFGKDRIQFFLLHRHYNTDCCFFLQQWNALDVKLRAITDRVYYVYKGFFTGKWLTTYYRIPYGIIIPDKKSQSEKLGEIVQGYCKPPLLVRLFAKRLYRPMYYKYFDSWEAPAMDPLPEKYKPYEIPKVDYNLGVIYENQKMDFYQSIRSRAQGEGTEVYNSIT